MKKNKAISASLLTFVILLTGQQANSLPSGASYVLPPSAPSNWIINPANPAYLPKPNARPRQQYSAIDSLYEKASDARWKNDYSTEFQIYNQIISLDPQEAQAHFNRGSIKQARLNDPSGALKDFEVAYSLFHQKGDQYMIKASKEHIQQLTASCSTCNNASPVRKPQKLSAVGSLYKKAYEEKSSGNHVAAVQTYSSIIRLDPKPGMAYFRRGVIKQDSLNDRAGALEDFKAAYKLFQQEGDDYFAGVSIGYVRKLSSR